MCIIVVKKEGYNIPKKEILQNCFNNNSDGAGFMYYYKNNVYIEKGFMNFDKFYKRIEKLKKEIDTKKAPMVFHFRIGTSGASDGTCTHPFELTNNEKNLKKQKSIVNIGIAHNGIISSYSDAKSTLNDTQLFIKDFLYPLYEIDKNFYNNEKIQDIILKVSSSKFAILTNKKELILIGDFIEKDGILYSNYTFEATRYTYFDYSKYNDKYYDLKDYNDYYYDDYDDYDDYDNYDKPKICELTYDDIMPLSDDECAIDTDETIFLSYDYRKKGELYVDYWHRLLLLNNETGELELVANNVEILNLSDFDEDNLEKVESEVLQ